ncbi:hypothetical protein P3T76_012241 [Phytophthora citrophthora]|uniref:RxLR effector protein n=1 Tax=Phytophthora citrophthora TaxID=4793 RepID=A0AAD9G5N4_9STRA|nr:hypothetical protein P3T76_012241 [Phytophthora citrophthora]
MRVPFILLLLSLLVVNYSAALEVEATPLINNHDNGGMLSTHSRRLRGSPRLESEERVGVNAAAAMNLLDSDSAVYMASNSPPMSKKAKAVVVLLTLGVAGGLTFGALKVLKSLQAMIISG